MQPLFEIYINRAFLEKLENTSEDQTYSDFVNNFMLKYSHGQVIIDGFFDFTEYQDFLVKKKFLNEIFNQARFENFTAQLQNDQFYKTGSGFKLFLLEDVDTEKLQTTYGFLFMELKSISKKWAYHCADGDSEFITSNEPIEGVDPQLYFKDWSQLGNSVGDSGNCLVLFDKYITGDISNQKLNDNLKPLLEHTLKKSSRKACIEILIICETIGTKDLDSVTVDDFIKIRSEVELYLKQKGIANCKIKFLLYPKAGKIGLDQKDKEHDRYFFTNYFYVKRAAGLNIFKERNKGVNDQSNLEIYSHLNYKRVQLKSIPTIQNIRRYVKSVNSLTPEKKSKFVSGKVIERRFSEDAVISNRLVN